MDFNLQTSSVLKLKYFNMDEWIAINKKFKTVMITKDSFVILYNEENLEENKERLILAHLGFDPDNEKGDEWIPEEEGFDDGIVVEKLNTDYDYYKNPFEYNPFVPEESEEEEESIDIRDILSEKTEENKKSVVKKQRYYRIYYFFFIKHLLKTNNLWDKVAWIGCFEWDCTLEDAEEFLLAEVLMSSGIRI